MNRLTKLQDHITTLLYNNSGRLSSLGLLNGRMGISIYFFHLAKKTKSKDYEHFAETMLEEVCDDIHLALLPNFDDGIPGIGWGLEYLLENKLLVADAEEVLIQFDEFIYTYLLKNNTTHNSFLHLLGFGLYFIKRIENKNTNKELKTIIKNKQLLIHVIDCLEKYDLNELFSIEEKAHLNRSFLLYSYCLFKCHALKIFSLKTEKIIRRLENKLQQNKNWITKLSNTLLLEWSILKSGIDIKDIANLKEIIDKNKVEKENQNFDLELLMDDLPLLKEHLGVFWLYQDLFDFSGKPYRDRANFIENILMKQLENTSLIDFVKKNPKTSYGLSSGLAGIGLTLLKTRECL